MRTQYEPLGYSDAEEIEDEDLVDQNYEPLEISDRYRAFSEKAYPLIRSARAESPSANGVRVFQPASVALTGGLESPPSVRAESPMEIA